MEDVKMENQNTPQEPKAKSGLKNFDLKEFVRNHLYEIIAVGGFLVCLIIFSFLPQLMTGSSRSTIWRSAVISTYIEQVTVYMILAVGATFVYMMGSMDISVGYQVGVMATVFIMIANASGSIILGLLVAIIIGVVCAIFNGITGAYIKLPTVMSSVILMQFFRGLMTLLYTDSGESSYLLVKDISWAGSTWFRIVSLVLLALVGAYILVYTKIGKRGRAIGANKRAADLAGAEYLKTRIIAYTIFGVFLVVATFFLVARTQGASEGDASSYQMDIMIMLLMGGMPLSGGMRTKLLNAIVGTLTYALLSTGLSQCRVDASYIFFIKAIIFVSIVILTCRKPGETLPR